MGRSMLLSDYILTAAVGLCLVVFGLLARFCFYYLSTENYLVSPGRIFEHISTPLGRIHCRRFAASTRRRDEICIAVGGIGGGECYWEEFLMGLSNMGVDVLAIDMPGRGGSDCPHGAYDQEFVTQWVTAAAMHHPWAQGRDIFLLGHSYGGAVCAVAATEPTPLQARVKHVVLLAPAGVVQRPLYTHFIHLTQLLPHPLCDL